jgi:asparagine synthase (glutamine-hydrolysing)
MCGIAGFWGLPGEEAALHARAARMAATLVHRGPDDDGSFADAGAGVGFGFRRLAILDLSPAGHQPMRSASGRYTVVFNGEIYDFAALRTELEARGQRFRGHSDTEVLLAAVEEWGLRAALGRLAGMFAFALWDARERTLSLVRDRVGIKPLYHGWTPDGTFLFASELKALRAHPAFVPEVDRGALALLLRLMHVPAPHTIYRGVRQLRPGHLLTLRSPREADAALTCWWSAREVAERGQAEPFAGSEAEAVEALEARLREAVRAHRVADVPIGAFLSGGIDSSSVVALMQAQSSRPVRTFSIGFREPGYDEAGWARGVARQLGTEHTELYVTPDEARAVIPKLPEIHDEPFADASAIPTWLVSQLARRDVTVSLSGDGGDELFGGYDRYVLAHPLWQRLRWLPGGLRRGLAAAIRALPPDWWSAALGPALRLAGQGGRAPRAGQRLHRGAALLGERTPEGLYRRLVSHWQEPSEVVLGLDAEPRTALSDPSAWPSERALPDFRQRMMLVDLGSYLPDDVLTKVDRASMAVGLEARVPLLDHRLVELAWRMPLRFTFGPGGGKRLLRQVLERHVPRPLIDRPKMGFGVPIDAWLRGPLREWAEALLEEGRLRREGFLRPAPVRRMWAEHLSERRDWQYPLWDVLTFQAWAEHWMRRA